MSPEERAYWLEVGRREIWEAVARAALSKVGVHEHDGIEMAADSVEKTSSMGRSSQASDCEGNL